MTTLVYRDGVLAADGQSQCSGWRQPGMMEKVWKVEGRLIGAAGDSNRVERFRRWAMAGGVGECPEMGDGSVGVIVEQDGRVREFESVGELQPSHAPFYAWGSGMPAALAALYMGATAERAVEIAILVDSSSGGNVQTVRL